MEHAISSRLCYPDPFKPVAIEFTLTEPAVVTLSISSESGNELVRLVDACRHEKGIHKIDLQSGILSTGLYFYRLQVEFPHSESEGNADNIVTEVRKFKL